MPVRGSLGPWSAFPAGLGGSRAAEVELLALRENSKEWAIGGDLSVLLFLGFPAPVLTLSTDAQNQKTAELPSL